MLPHKYIDMREIREKLKENGKRNPLFPVSLSASTQIYPRESAGHMVDLAATKTPLRTREELLVSEGVVATAPEENNSENELKELFAIPRSNRENICPE